MKRRSFLKGLGAVIAGALIPNALIPNALIPSEISADPLLLFMPIEPQWQHVAMIKKAGVVRYFIDAVECSSLDDILGENDWSLDLHEDGSMEGWVKGNNLNFLKVIKDTEYEGTIQDFTYTNKAEWT